MNVKPPPLPKRTQMTPAVWVAVILPLILLMTALSCFGFWRWRLHQQLVARTNAIRAAGLPTNWEELNHWQPQVPDNENAALIFTNAGRHIFHGTIPSYPFELPHRAEIVPADVQKTIDGVLKTNREALQIAYTALPYEKSRYSVNYLDGPNARLPHLSGLRGLGWCATFDALTKAEAGDSQGAVKAVEVSIAVARSLDGEPLMISQHAAGRILIQSCQNLERVLCRCRIADGSLAELSAELASEESTNRFLTGLIGERALYMEFIRLAQDDPRKMVQIANEGITDADEKIKPPSRNPGFGWKALGFVARDRVFFLQAMDTNFLVATTPPPASLDMDDGVEKIFSQARSGYHVFCASLLSSATYPAQSDAALHANLRIALTALAIERWRSAHQNALPGTLNDLVPAYLPSVFTDPFDGQPIRYKQLSRGYVVYSVGRDRHDDGGKEQPPMSVKIPPGQRDHFDITFTVDR